MRKLCLYFALVSFILAFTSGLAAADPVNLRFDINVLAAHGALEEIFGTPIKVGDVLHGSVTYDPAASDHNPDPLYGSYLPSGQIAILDGAGVTLPLQFVTVIDNQWGGGYPTDYFAAVTEFDNVPGFSQVTAIAEFYGPPTAQDGDALPATAAAFRAMYFTRGSFQFSANKNGVEPPWDDTTHAFAGTIQFSDTNPAAVPEPATLLLLGTGAIGIAARVRKRRQLPTEP
jgi:hypothetical protein